MLQLPSATALHEPYGSEAAEEMVAPRHKAVLVKESREEERLNKLARDAPLRQSWGSWLMDWMLFVGGSFLYVMEGTGTSMSYLAPTKSLSPGSRVRQPN